MPHAFVHASDLHLGKPFGGFPEAIRHRLREARHGAIARIAQGARAAGVRDVLLAGDTFDAETPAPDTLRHALRAMAEASDLRWLVLPGNHDSLAASELWRRIALDRPENVIPLLTPAPFELAAGVQLLPAPCTQRRPGRDLTETMSQPTPEGALRIGLGHGAITDFSGSDFQGEDGSIGIIAPDRAQASGLDYLGLGDWHGRIEVGPRTWYSGTPERDAFKHDQEAAALVVRIAAPGARPEVTLAPTGQFTWSAREISALVGDDPLALLEACLPAPAARRDVLMRLTARGRITLAGHARLSRATAEVAPDFGWFEADLQGLALEAGEGDLDRIERGGSLRRAAEMLETEARDLTLDLESRERAAAALARLLHLVEELQP